jgi:DNA-binding GntR family transcriptional regulator
MTLGWENSLVSVKGGVAGVLREEIISGRIGPDEPIAEGKWAAKLKVAQASVREALNILAAEGFVEKELGRSARVTALSEKDVSDIFQIRAPLEGLAARLIATNRPDLSELDQTIADMRSAVECRNMRIYCERDLRFHLLICEKSGNPFLLEHVRRLIVPLFAFIVLRQHAAMDESDRWQKGYETHRRILAFLHDADPETAEREVSGIVGVFRKETLGLLESQFKPEAQYS